MADMLQPQPETGIAVLDAFNGTAVRGYLREYLLAHGERFDRIPTPDQYSDLPSEMRGCFRNSFHGNDQYPELTYVEGWAFGYLDGFPIHHAWLTDSDGNAIDSTWPEGIGREYFGVRIPRETLVVIALQTEHYGVFEWGYMHEVRAALEELHPSG